MTRFSNLRAAIIGEAPTVPEHALTTAARRRAFDNALRGMEPMEAAAMLGVCAADLWGRNRAGTMLERARDIAEGRG